VQLKAFWATLMRRWYLLLLALACTALATFFTVDNVGPTYEAKGAVLFMPPVTSVQKGDHPIGNPYLMLDGLSQIRDIVIRALQAQTTHDELCQKRGDAAYEAMRQGLCKENNPDVTYEAAGDFTNRAPIIIVTVDADTPADAVIALGAVTNRVPEILTSLQAGLKLGANAEITSTLLVADKEPEIVRKSQIRAGIVAGAGTLGLCLLMIGLFDGLLTSRRSKSALQARHGEISTEFESKAEPIRSSASEPAQQHSEAEPIRSSAQEPAQQHSEAEPIPSSAHQPVQLGSSLTSPLMIAHSEAQPVLSSTQEPPQDAQDTSLIWPLMIAHAEAEPVNSLARQPVQQDEQRSAAAPRG
jgi:hypothetical protein